MAAEMAVEITAQEEIQTEDHHQTVQEDHSAVDHLIVQEDHLVRVMREEATAATVQEEHLEKVVTDHREEPSVKVVTVQEDHSERAETDQEDHVSVATDQQVATVQEEATARVLREEHSVTVHREEHSVTVHSREDLQAEGISTTSATRTRAESAR